MHALTLSVLAMAASLASPLALARPGHSGGGAQVAPSHGGTHWAGGSSRPGYGQGYGYAHGGGRHGYPGYRHGYGYPGYGYGLGVGLGIGYGASWAVTAGWPWYWGAPAAYYGAPAFSPYGYWAPGYPALVSDEGLGYAQQLELEIAPPAPRTTTSYWYYCTEPAGYYPYVQQCTRPWVAVQPNAVPPPGSAPSGAPAR